MKYVLAVGLLACVGCAQAREFGAGFRDRGLEMAGEISADALAEIVDKKLDADFGELKDALATIPGKIPQPKSPVEETVWYGLGGLLAYVVGSFGKGAVRKYGKKA